MAKRSSKSNGAITVIVILILILLAIAGFIAYSIYKARQRTPTTPTTTTSTCCLCSWQLENRSESFSAVFNMGGILQTNTCKVFSDLAEGTEINNCRNFSNDFGDWRGDSKDLGSCINTNSLGSLANPPLPTNDETPVTLTTIFATFKSDTKTKGFDGIKLEFNYPDGIETPEEISATFDENGNISEGESNFIISKKDFTLPGEQEATLYIIKYEAPWNTLINSSTPGSYKILFSAKYTDEEKWTTTSAQSTLEFIVEEERERQSFCNNLDISSQGNISPLNVTINADASIAQEGADPIFKWSLDLNCDGQIDTATQGENAEQFITTGANQNRVTRIFTLSDGQDSADCAASVEVYASQADYDSNNAIPERRDGSCQATIQVRKPSADCGNGVCDPNETCDTSGNINCIGSGKGSMLPAGTICRNDCTYCGDGILNGNEQCDPNIPAGQAGHNANCQADCTIQQEEPQPPPQEQSGIIVTGSTDKTCIELVSPNNLINITIRIDNQTTEQKTVRAISNTLPRGLSYVPGTSQINTTSSSDPIIESSGESQLLTWNNGGAGWVLPSQGSITVIFRATAGPNSHMGEQPNQITVTLADQNPIPASNNILVAQNCSQPLTGIFDNTIFIILMGTALLVIAGAAYYTGFGSQKIAVLMDNVENQAKKTSKSAKAVKNDLVLLVSQPQKFMEKSIEESALKDINKHADDKKNKKNKKK